VPIGCKIDFSADGARHGYATVAHRRLRDGGDDARYWFVIDGVARETRGQAWIARLTPLLSLVSVEAAQYERQLLVVEAATPARPPSDDEYTPASSGGPRPITRVVLGESVGPAFDEVDIDSFERGADGVVRYVGLRGEQRVAVADNVIAAPAAPVIAQ
jgi:hypothetical protein